MSQKPAPKFSSDPSAPYGWSADEIPDKARLKTLIRQIGPKAETWSGEKMYTNLSDEKDGEIAVLDAAAELKWMLDEGDGPDLAEMKKELRTHCKRVIKPALNPMRREFIRSSVWWLVGCAGLFNSAARLADHGYQSLTPAGEKPSKEEENYAKAAHEIYEDYVQPYEDMLVGAALVNEGIEKWEEIRLRQIKDWVLALTKNTSKEKLAALSKEDLEHIINAKSATFGKSGSAGFQFFRELLKERKDLTLNFLDRAKTTIDKQNELDLEIDFDPAEHALEREIFDKIRCNPRRLSASDFLETWGWIIPGAAFASEGMSKAHYHHIQGHPPKTESRFTEIIQNISEPGQMLLGWSLINEFRINWKEIKLEQIADAVLDLSKKNINWETISDRDLKALIDNMEYPEEKFAGIYFLDTLLQSQEGGKKAVRDFLARAQKTIDAESAENLPNCFTPQEKTIFKKFNCRPNLIDTQNLLHTVGWGFPGLICTLTGAASAAHLACGAVNGKKETFAGKVHHTLHKYAGPFEGFAVDLALINEAVEQWGNHHLGQVSDATANLVQRLEKLGIRFWTKETGLSH